jgi:SpoVK/Ycf46/Vps4 family AAA+-type ATPase
MKADLLKRLIRAIADGSRDDIAKVARKVVDNERDSGHERLAKELDAILSRPKHPAPLPDNDNSHQFRELPVSRRHREQLATFTPRAELEHTMVLPLAVEERFARVEREFAARERLGVFGLRPRKKILLYGPPGCGKSLGAKRLAWNTGLPLMKVRFDALLSSYFGESLANLRSVFEAAKEKPCVLLLDECDFIARSRGAGSDVGEASRVVNMLLQLLDDYEAPGLLVATTNLESSLDDALFRRFDDVFEVPPPGPDEAERLVRMTLSGVEISPKASLTQLVSKLGRMSAAHIVKAAQNAAKAAVLGGKKIVEDHHLRVAFAEAGAASDPERQP